MMKKIGQLGFVVVAFFTAVSCEQGLFGTNIFGGLEGEYKMPNFETARSEEIVKAAEDDRFYEEVESLEEEKVDKLVETLQTTAEDTGAEPIDRKKAALTASEVKIRSKGAKDAVEEANDLITKLVVDRASGNNEKNENPDGEADSSIDFKKPSEVVKKLFPEDTTVEEVKEQLEGLREAAKDFRTYGELLKEDEEAGREQTTPAGFNAGDVAAKALLAGTVEKLVEATKDDDGNSLGDKPAAVEKLADTIVKSLNPDTSDALEKEYEDLGGGNLEDLLGPDIYRVVNNGLELENLGLGGD